MPYLMRRLDSWGPVALHYVGSGHTLAFQKLSNDTKPDEHDTSYWDKLHSIDVYANPDRGRVELIRLCERLQPILLVTVMDARVAAAALTAGCRVVVIDQLLWFRPQIPAPWLEAERVIATAFYGVKERIARDQLANAVSVPPLGPPVKTDDVGPRKNIIVLNLGGLLNPYVPAAEYTAYARIVYRAARRALDLRNAALQVPAELIVLAVSSEVARSIDPGDSGAARAVWPDEAITLMATAELVCCTPGLGNLHAVAAIAQEVLLLPPVNNSQGLQWLMLEQGGIHVDAVDWHQLTGGEPVDYTGGKVKVFDGIHKAQGEVISSAQARNLLADRMFAAMIRGSSAGPSAQKPPLRALVTAFGQDSGDAIAAQVVNVLKR
ncbi:hypothetical protein HIM_08933 [Hirsutella minnesotensis 3608]|uniref:Glycosyl transferase family 28 C-terminal domain-containing protein n=1 Tax=Hirsutella minnesotensis 3608 TaxID=1043627 RepID=A0A0F7ZY13_9HYPO|nr:hypothetical protein HIM_08933 [Hirsutella minnesotensis 3608]